MKKILLTTILITTSIIIYGQDVCKISTNDLIKISESFGLDSAIITARGFPIYFLDKNVSKKLFQDVLVNKPSSTIENFLNDYAWNVKDDKSIPIVLTEYYKTILKEVDTLQPDNLGFFPSISMNMLFTFIKNKSTETENFLKDYYYLWYNKSEEFKEDYYIGLEIKDFEKNLKLTIPYAQSNLFCFRILLALDSMKSNFFDNNKLEYHKNFLKENWGKKIYLSRNYSRKDYTEKQLFRTITLTKSYNNIGELDFANEPELNQMLNNYLSSYCWREIIYNKTKGYLDLGCQSGPLAGDGMILELELKGNKLILYYLYSWIS